VNREQRRALERSRYVVRWLVAQETCPDCGAPVCPSCGRETAVCECCGEFNCDRCNAYVTPPVPRAESLT
jgi:NADH pyrophosphatase NudC (nudix superfamily)